MPSLYQNFTPYACAESMGLDARGVEYYLLVVKATYVWDEQGQVQLADEMQPVAQADEFAGDPATSGLRVENDLAPEKPAVDVLLQGAIKLPRPVPQVDIALQVGQRIRKTARVIGDRYWVATAAGLTLSNPAPFDEMPLEWDRACGGADPDDLKHRDMRNPSGPMMRKDPKKLTGARAPNFEAPGDPVRSWKGKYTPIGFGPVGRHWKDRRPFAGSYDEAWERDRAPLLALDFNPRYYNCAPVDQQLPDYRPGEDVTLAYMTERGRERFFLPELDLTVVRVPPRGAQLESRPLRPDTIIIEPAARRFSLVARYLCYPKPSCVQLGLVLVGPQPDDLAQLNEALHPTQSPPEPTP